MLPTGSATGLEVDCLAFDMEARAIQIRSCHSSNGARCPTHETPRVHSIEHWWTPIVPLTDYSYRCWSLSRTTWGRHAPPDRSRRPETTTMFHVKPLHRRSIETDDPTPYHAQGEQWASGPGRADSPAVSQCTGNRRHTAVSQRPIADVEPGPPSCDRQCGCHRVHGRAVLQASKSYRTLLPTPSAGGPRDRMRAH